MFKIILNRSLFLAGFKVEKFTPNDYRTMCSLIKEKHPLYNEAIEIHKDVKLLDEKGKLVGRYSASEARKKATTLKKDIVLLNPNSDPVVCKLYNFRETILRKFYDEIVNKRNEQLIKKASSSKHLKLSLNLTESEMQIKSKQIIELAKKNLNVRVYMNCKEGFENEGLVKFDYLKSLIQNKCTVQKDIKIEEQKADDEDDWTTKKNAYHGVTKSISMVLKSKENQFMSLLTESSEKDQDSAVTVFLKRYYKQEDVEMKDLKANEVTDNKLGTSLFEGEIFDLEAPRVEKVEKKQAVRVKKPEGKKGKKEQEQEQDFQKAASEARQNFRLDKEKEKKLKETSFIQRQAKARILNLRLKRILEVQI